MGRTIVGRTQSRGIALMAILTMVAMLAVAPATSAATAINLTTPYPAVAVAPGSNPSFEISITTAQPGRVNLAVAKVPADWVATLRGGGFTVDGIESDGATATKVTLSVTVPSSTASGTQRIDVTGTTASGATATLSVDVRVAPNAAGDVTLTTDIPQLKGASNATFSFTLTLTNSTSDDLPFSVAGTGPDGWTVTAQVGSQAQAASVVVKAGSTSPVTVSVKAAETAAAGSYPVTIDATSGNRTASADLAVEITGSYKLALSTVDGRLNMNATAGSPTDLTLTLTNSGTADIEGVALSASAPSGWKVTFEPVTVAVPAGKPVEVVAKVVPSGDAIAGDYVTTFKASSPVATATSDVRVTIETSLLWGAMGLGLIAVVFIGLWSVFHRFGRR